MSVQMNQYLTYGYMLDYDEGQTALEEKVTPDGIDDVYDKYYDSAYDEEIVEINGFSLIPDCMDGGYIFFGKIFKKSDVDQPLPSSTIPEISEEMKSALMTEFKSLFGDTLKDTAQVHLLTHYR
jgi:hypothetical protein